MEVFSAAEMTEQTPDHTFRRRILETPSVRAFVIGYPAAYEIPNHAHLESDEIFFVISGRAIFTAAGRHQEVGPGDSIAMPAGVFHQITSLDEPIVMVAVVSPNLDDAEFPDLQQP